jgi:hypothetical protein
MKTDMVQNDVESSIELEEALSRCRKAARHGYAIAKENLVETAKAINGVSESLSNCLKSLGKGSVRTPGIVTQLEAQLSGVVAELDELQKTSSLTLKERRKHLDSFSVTLFGRTMAGKSTLMEILTEGNGKSIGTGSQRTTRDVRGYQWKGLEVTDVPGVAAFEGADDEELAFKAAAQADLVLFLITDDAPQPVEAECLAQVRRLGKPVLGVCNVKIAVDAEDDLLLFLRNPYRHFDQYRIKQLIQQFHLLADQYIPGKWIPFEVTHLRARFLAYQPGFEKHRDQLLKASCFNSVESHIVNEVVNRGTFLRVKSFIDGSVTPMLDLSDLLLGFSAQNSSSGRVLVDKERQIREWARDFKSIGHERINTVVSKVMDSLRDEVPSFAENHYEDRAAGDKWRKLVESHNVIRNVEKLQKELLNECTIALSEIARELKSELSLVADLSSDRDIKMDSIFNTKRVWSWGTSIISGGLGIAALILGSGPLGWAAAAVASVGWLISLFFDDREEKVRRARATLSERLVDNINKMERDLRKNINDWFDNELLRKQVYVLLDDLGTVTSGLFKLADAQRALAWALNDRQKKLGHSLVEEALSQLGALSLLDSISDVARVPGFATMFLIQPHFTFSGHIRSQLEKLLCEKIWFVIDTKNSFSILSQAIGRNCEKSEIHIEERIRVAHIPLDDLDTVTKARVRLAQQLTGLHIMR